jgi:hypothetical protein
MEALRTGRTQVSPAPAHGFAVWSTGSFGISQALCKRVAQSKCCWSSLPLSPRPDPKGNSMFVHPGCTNSSLRRTPEDLPESVCVPESPTGPVACLRLLELCHLRLSLLFIRYMSSSFFIRSDYICCRLDLPLFGPPGSKSPPAAPWNRPRWWVVRQSAIRLIPFSP